MNDKSRKPLGAGTAEQRGTHGCCPGFSTSPAAPASLGDGKSEMGWQGLELCRSPGEFSTRLRDSSHAGVEGRMEGILSRMQLILLGAL